MNRTSICFTLISFWLISGSARAGLIYAANGVSVTGGSVDQIVSYTPNKFSGGNTIVSGVSTVETVQNYTILPQGTAGGGTNFRFAGGNFGEFAYLYNSSLNLNLNGFLLWNYSQNGAGQTYSERGLTSAKITVTYNGGLTSSFYRNFSLTPDNNVFDVPTTAQFVYFDQVFPIVTEIRFSELQGGDPTYRGYQEILAFNSPIPEPSTYALGCVAISIGVYRFSRKRFSAK